MNKRYWWIIGSLFGLIALLIILKKTGKIGKDDTIKVSTEEIVERTITESVVASGKIFPEVEVKISSDVSGEITELNVAEGDSVKTGQILARVYADIYHIAQQQANASVKQQEFLVANTEAQLQALKGNLQHAETQYERQEKLLKEKVISKQEFEATANALQNAKANLFAMQKSISAGKQQVEGARANLHRASKDVSRATIVAPMDGVVSLLNVKKGERVVGTAQMAGTEMLRVANMSKMEIR